MDTRTMWFFHEEKLCLDARDKILDKCPDRNFFFAIYNADEIRLDGAFTSEELSFIYNEFAQIKVKLEEFKKTHY